MRTIILPPNVTEDTADMLRVQYWEFVMSLRYAPPATRAARVREWFVRRSSDFDLPAGFVRNLVHNIHTRVTYVRS